MNEIETLSTINIILIIAMVNLFIISILGLFSNSLYFAERKARKDLIKNKNLSFGNIAPAIKWALIGLRKYGIDISIIEFVSIKDEYVIYKYQDNFYRADIEDQIKIIRVEEFSSQFDLTQYLDCLTRDRIREINE